MSHSMNTYSRIPVAFTRGERVWVWDESGKKYLDALAGIAVNPLVHRQPQSEAGIRAPGYGLRARAVQRHRIGAPGCFARQERRRRAGRADPGRRRNQYLLDAVPARTARALRPSGLVSHGGRSPV